MNRLWDSLVERLVRAAEPRVICEVGTATGAQTERLLDLACEIGAVVHAIDTRPAIDVGEWQRKYPNLRFHVGRSLDILPRLHDLDVALLDGDHNWFTVLHELRTLENQAVAAGRLPPLILLHDVTWPYGRRDLYYDPSAIPDEFRHDYALAGLTPGEPHVTPDGLNRHLANARAEGGPRNGVLTAIEDFMAGSDGQWKLKVVPALHGLGVLVSAARLAASPGVKQVIAKIRSPAVLTELLCEVEMQRISAEVRAEELRYRCEDSARILAAIADQVADNESMSARGGRARPDLGDQPATWDDNAMAAAQLTLEQCQRRLREACQMLAASTDVHAELLATRHELAVERAARRRTERALHKREHADQPGSQRPPNVSAPRQS